MTLPCAHGEHSPPRTSVGQQATVQISAVQWSFVCDENVLDLHHLAQQPPATCGDWALGTRRVDRGCTVFTLCNCNYFRDQVGCSPGGGRKLGSSRQLAGVQLRTSQGASQTERNKG